MYFHQATKDRRILLIPGIHYFDAHRLQPLLLQASALQVHNYLPDVYAGKVCPPFHVNRVRTVAAGVIETVEEVFAHAARSFTLRLAETLSQYICSLTSRVPGYPRDGMPAVCHFLVSSNPL